MLARHLCELRKLSGSKLREQRYAKFRTMGRFVETAAEPEAAEAGENQ